MVGNKRCGNLVVFVGVALQLLVVGDVEVWKGSDIVVRMAFATRVAELTTSGDPARVRLVDM